MAKTVLDNMNEIGHSVEQISDRSDDMLRYSEKWKVLPQP